MKTATISYNQDKNDAKIKSLTVDTIPLHNKNFKEQLDDCTRTLDECCSSLFDLTLMVPSAPRVRIKKSINCILTTTITKNHQTKKDLI
jgi:hypothetical protein